MDTPASVRGSIGETDTRVTVDHVRHVYRLTGDRGEHVVLR